MLRTASIVVLSVLTALVGVGVERAESSRIQAQDTTWSVQAGGSANGGAQDTTWAAPVGDSSTAGVAQVQPADTTW
ncbi:hypothetical protein [Streptomyces sp. NPDC051677]|uniref:hypothetical protein n=1 Tax=Streptomyces sp. NPDC051677 TaxID=3365669 RepID=UPI0037D0913A